MCSEVTQRAFQLFVDFTSYFLEIFRRTQVLENIIHLDDLMISRHFNKLFVEFVCQRL